MSPPGGGGSVDARTVIKAAWREVLKSDNRRKLGVSGVDERHLAVYVYLTNYLPWYALVGFEPPPDLPQLPPEITDLWLFSETRSPDEYVVWRANKASRWHSQRIVLNGV